VQAGTFAERWQEGAAKRSRNACGRDAAGGTCQAMRVVPSRMIAARLTWIVVTGIVALLVVAAIDALRSSEPESAPSGLESASGTPAETTPAETGASGVCGPEQLELRLERLGTDLGLELRNVTETPCRQRRLPITLTLLDRQGHPVEATTNIQEGFRPTTYSPNVDVIAGFVVLYKCGAAKAAIFRAGAGSYHAGGRLPRSDTECLNDLGP
jgi:hypothetical protein